MLSALVMLPASYYWPIQDAYHPLNDGWNGCSGIAALAMNSTLLVSYNRDLPKNSTLVIIGPSLPFSASDATIIRDHLQNNGTVLLADDIGSGNGLLDELNVSVRFAGKPLADLFAYSKNPEYPLVSAISPGSISTNVSVLILDHPSFLEMNVSGQVTLLAASSPFSFIDLKGDGRPAQNESVNSYPLMAYAHVGRGTLIIIANPAMFINELIGLYDNNRLFQNILKTGGGSLVFDVAHLENAPLTNALVTVKNSIAGLVSFARGSIYFQAIVVVLILAGGLPLHMLRHKSQRREG